MKKALALLGTIIFVFSIVPMGAFASDDYSDHTSNIPPYVQGLIGMFSSNSSYYVRFSDFEIWNQGISVGTSTGNTVPTNIYYDTLDIDFEFYFPASIVNNTILFEFYLTDLYNIDYIELYSLDTHKAISIAYYTTANNSLYLVCPGNSFNVLDWVLRIHFKPLSNAYQVSYVGQFGNVKIHDNTTNSSYQSNLTDWYYLGALLRELEEISDSIDYSNIDFSTVESTTNTILNYMRNNFNWYSHSLYQNSGYSYAVSMFYFGQYNNLSTPLNYTFNSSSSGTQFLDFQANTEDHIFYIGVNTGIRTTPFAQFISVMIPLSFYNFNMYSSMSVVWAGGQINRNFTQVESYFDYSYPASWRFVTDASNNYFLQVNIYNGNGTHNFNAPGNMVWLKFTLHVSRGASSFDIKQNVSYDSYTTSWHTVSYNDKMLGSTKSIEFLLQQLTSYIMSGALSGGADSGNYPSYPSGPSDPTDPNQTTNIYDVNIEFNTQVGDISLFENTYSEQLPGYDNTVSQQYLLPISSTYDFSDLNSTFGSIWQNSFQYEYNENDEISGIYGIGLYFIIPLVLLVLFALFRRVTN